MVLIVDSGSTKADWILLEENGQTSYDVINTKGLNPAVVSKNAIKLVLENNKELTTIADKVNSIFFYGAGCGTEKPKLTLKSILQDFFKNAKINIHEDTYAAVFSTIKNENQKAIVCILGTGSNCSYYDGKTLHQKVTSLGYSIMDDASGNYFGKELLRDFFYNKMPKDISEDFSSKYDLKADTIKQNLYKEAFPNAYLANFARFMSSHKSSNYIKNLITKGINRFVENMLLQYKDELKEVPVNFVGSIALFCKDEILEAAKIYNFKVGVFEAKPINGLVKFHSKN